MRRLRYLLGIFFMVAIFTSLTSQNLKADDSQLDAFIERLYQNILGRNADAEGLSVWKNKMKNEGWSATQVAKFFYDSPEFKSLNLSDSEFLDRTYKTFFDREADSGGKAYWLDQLENFGKKREAVFYGFALSDEFKQVCQNYGVVPYNQEDGIKAFTVRFYNIILGRESDPGGLDYWVKQLKNQQASGVDIVKYFFNSPEYKSKNKSDDEFVTDAYKTMLDRIPDETGFKFWKGLLERGYSRDKIIDMMADSNEFKNMEKKYLQISSGEEEDSGSGNGGALANGDQECFVQVTGSVPNDFGKVRIKKTEIDSDGDGKTDMVQIFEYDANNCVTREIFKGYPSKEATSMEITAKNEYTYSNKLLTVAKSFGVTNSQDMEFSRTYYEYYPNGNYKTIKTDSFPIDGVFSVIVTYNEDNTLEKTDEDADGIIDSQTQYFYDSKGNIIKSIDTDFISNTKEIDKYIYDSKGNLIEIDTDESLSAGDKPDGVIDEKTFFEYDLHNNLISTWSEVYAPGLEATPKTHITYDYSNLTAEFRIEGSPMVSKSYYERY